MNFLVLAMGFSSMQLICPALAQTKNGLQVGFYNKKCPQAETIVAKTVAKYFRNDKSVPAALLRMHFHDCFVRGCDASILIDSIEGKNIAEKEALPNLTVRGFEIIDEAKVLLEKACPRNVSCADIIALATRDAVSLAKGPFYSLPTGRRDGSISSINEVDLPSPRERVADAAGQFKTKGLNLQDMVVLLGAHTVGVSHCAFFSDRLYDFQQTGKADPSMNSSFVKILKKVCPSPSTSETSSLANDPTVFLDQGTPFLIDNSYYKQLGMGEGVLQFDQELTRSKTTKSMVKSLATSGTDFRTKFAAAMIKMGNIGVLTGNKGEIRSQCRVVNPKSTKLIDSTK